jgi:hypothetical protein
MQPQTLPSVAAPGPQSRHRPHPFCGMRAAPIGWMWWTAGPRALVPHGKCRFQRGPTGMVAAARTQRWAPPARSTTPMPPKPESSGRRASRPPTSRRCWASPALHCVPIPNRSRRVAVDRHRQTKPLGESCGRFTVPATSRRFCSLPFAAVPPLAGPPCGR